MGDTTTTVDGTYTMTFPPGDSSIAWDLRRGRPYEWRLLRMATLLDAQRAIDVGAHIGNHTIYLAMRGVEVTAVEPNPAARRYLTMNIAANDLSDLVKVVPVAVGAQPGTGALVADGRNLGKTSVDASGNGPVQVTTVDSLGVSADLLKIDVEGGETDVLDGAVDTLANYHPAVIVESHHNRVAVAEKLSGFGYRQVARSLAYSPTWLFCARPEHLAVRAQAWRWSLGGSPRRVTSGVARWVLRKPRA